MNQMPVVAELGTAAIGTIGPAPRLERGEIDEATLEEVAARVASGEFHDAVSDELGPNAAGGTFSLVVADALTTKRFMQPGMDAQQHTEALYSWLVRNKNDAESRRIIPRVCIDGRLPVEGSLLNPSVVGGHSGPGGCGAQEKLGPVFLFITQHPEEIRDQAEALGIAVDDNIHKTVVENANWIIAPEMNYVVPGANIRAATIKIGGLNSVTELAGPHNEVLGNMNWDKARTLNRGRLAAAFGDAYEGFNFDVGVFPEAAAAISLSESEASQKTVAMTYYNIATGMVLGHSSLLITETR